MFSACGPDAALSCMRSQLALDAAPGPGRGSEAVAARSPLGTTSAISVRSERFVIGASRRARRRRRRPGRGSPESASRTFCPTIPPIPTANALLDHDDRVAPASASRTSSSGNGRKHRDAERADVARPRRAARRRRPRSCRAPSRARRRPSRRPRCGSGRPARPSCGRTTAANSPASSGTTSSACICFACIEVPHLGERLRPDHRADRHRLVRVEHLARLERRQEGVDLLLARDVDRLEGVREDEAVHADHHRQRELLGEPERLDVEVDRLLVRLRVELDPARVALRHRVGVVVPDVDRRADRAVGDASSRSAARARTRCRAPRPCRAAPGSRSPCTPARPAAEAPIAADIARELRLDHQVLARRELAGSHQVGERLDDVRLRRDRVGATPPPAGSARPPGRPPASLRAGYARSASAIARRRLVRGRGGGDVPLADLAGEPLADRRGDRRPARPRRSAPRTPPSSAAFGSGRPEVLPRELGRGDRHAARSARNRST